MSTVLETKEEPEHFTPEPLLKELTNEFALYRDQIRSYLEKVGANLEQFKFVVEKKGEGIEIGVEIRALVHSNRSHAIEK
jgi:hypothetical protein